MIQVAVMGYGTIGSGVVEVLETNKDKITEKTGKEIAVKYILDLREFPGDPHEAQIVHDFESDAAFREGVFREKNGTVCTLPALAEKRV